MPRLRGAVVVVAVLVATASTRADDATEARFHDSLGRRAYAARHFEEALEHFLDAHAASPTLSSLFNTGLCAYYAHRDALAYEFLSEYLERSDPEENEERRTDARRRCDELATRLALVHVESDPAGADIEVVGADLGSWGRTPTTIVLDPGEHQLRLTREGRVTTEIAVTAVRGERRDVSISLELELGVLVVDAGDVDAEIEIFHADERLALGASGAELSVPVGSHRVVARAEGFRPQERLVRIVAGEEERLMFELVALPAPSGRLAIETPGVEARVWVDGVERGATPLLLPAERAGEHRLELRAAGRELWAEEIHVRRDETTSLAITLLPTR